MVPAPLTCCGGLADELDGLAAENLPHFCHSTEQEQAARATIGMVTEINRLVLLVIARSAVDAVQTGQCGCSAPWTAGALGGLRPALMREPISSDCRRCRALRDPEAAEGRSGRRPSAGVDRARRQTG
jgi:hypothetical protein